MSTRRAFLAALPAVAAAIPMLPTAAAEQLADPAQRVDELMQDLAAALDEYQRGTFRAIVEPSSDGIAWLQNRRLPVPPPPSDSNSQLASMHLGGRRVLVDLTDLPKQSTVVDEETVTEWRPSGVTEHTSEPDVEAEYVVLTHEAEILITRLEANYSPGPADPRRGFMSGTYMGYRASRYVRVLGKVVSEG